jgi:hypothetical protein
VAACCANTRPVLVSWAECYTTPRLLRSPENSEFIESFSRAHPRQHQRKIFRTNIEVLAHPSP